MLLTTSRHSWSYLEARVAIQFAQPSVMQRTFCLCQTTEGPRARSFAYLVGHQSVSNIHGGLHLGQHVRCHYMNVHPAGDIRSRLIRLIPLSLHKSPLDCIRNLLAYRLPAYTSEREARDEWRDIVEGRSILWSGIPDDRKETIRGQFDYALLSEHPLSVV